MRERVDPMGLESFPKASQGFRPALSYAAPVRASRGVQLTAPYGCALTTHSFLSRGTHRKISDSAVIIKVALKRGLGFGGGGWRWGRRGMQARQRGAGGIFRFWRGRAGERRPLAGTRNRDRWRRVPWRRGSFSGRRETSGCRWRHRRCCQLLKMLFDGAAFGFLQGLAGLESSSPRSTIAWGSRLRRPVQAGR